jgi:gluconokinase
MFFWIPLDSATNMNFVPSKVFLVVMGVAGCGKSSLGQVCAAHLRLPLLEGDDFHSANNVNKMRSGVPLSDDDRQTWLDTLAAQLQAHPAGVVLTCSALRQRYRDRLRAAVPGLRFVFLSLTQDEARERVAARPGHLFPVSLVASQFETLEDPSHEPGVLRVDATRPLAELGAQVQQWLEVPPGAAPMAASVSHPSLEV